MKCIVLRIVLSTQIILSFPVCFSFSAAMSGDIYGAGPSLADLMMSAWISLSISSQTQMLRRNPIRQCFCATVTNESNEQFYLIVFRLILKSLRNIVTDKRRERVQVNTKSGSETNWKFKVLQEIIRPSSVPGTIQSVQRKLRFYHRPYVSNRQSTVRFKTGKKGIRGNDNPPFITIYQLEKMTSCSS